VFVCWCGVCFRHPVLERKRKNLCVREYVLFVCGKCSRYPVLAREREKGKVCWREFVCVFVGALLLQVPC